MIYSVKDIQPIRLDVFLSREADITRSNAKKVIDESGVLVNGVLRDKASFELKEGDEVSFEVPKPVKLEAVATDIPIEIVYEDEFFAVVNKPQGMVVHQATSYHENDTLVNALLYHLESLSSINGVIRPGIVHRIDKNTSGLLVVAKNDEAHLSLASQIENKTARRRYLGLCDGNFKEDTGTVDAPIARSKNDRKKMAIVSGGRHAVTHYKVIERFGNYTLVQFELETGRTHQIRVHAASIHHPIVGDDVYGGSTTLYQKGQLLHAYELVLTHPKSGERMCFHAPLPEHFQSVLRRLRNKKKQ